MTATEKFELRALAPLPAAAPGPDFPAPEERDDGGVWVNATVFLRPKLRISHDASGLTVRVAVDAPRTDS